MVFQEVGGVFDNLSKISYHIRVRFSPRFL